MPCLLAILMVTLAEIPEPFGVNIHFTKAPEAELDLLGASGFRWVRMDLVWSQVERRIGVCDFSSYDTLVKEMTDRGIRILFILDYGHPSHTRGMAPVTDGGRKAFIRFARAAVHRYRGRGIIWEVWNEPNIVQFWRPQPSPQLYTSLAVNVARAIKEIAPEETVVGLATSRVDLDFIGECVRLGILDALDGVTVHPYRSEPPDTWIPEYHALRGLIERYRPGMNILSGEWGYHTVDLKPRTQAAYLARELLINTALGIPVSIWYDWRDDGPDPAEPEHNFGTVTVDLEPKPAFRAVQAIASGLEGLRAHKTFVDGEVRWLLLFRGDGPGIDRAALVGWCDGPKRAVPVPFGLSGSCEVVRLDSGPEKPSSGRIEIDGLPVILKPEKLSDLLLLQAVHPSSPRFLSARVGDPFEWPVRLANPFERPIEGRLRWSLPEGVQGAFQNDGRFKCPPRGDAKLLFRGKIEGYRQAHYAIEEQLEVEGKKVFDTVHLYPRNAVEVGVDTPKGKKLSVRVTSDDREGFSGRLLVAFPGETDAPKREHEVKVQPGATGAWEVELPGDSAPGPGVRCDLVTQAGVPAVSITRRFRLVEDFSAGAEPALDPIAEGDPKVDCEAKLEAADEDGDRAARLTYRVGDGWKYIPVRPRKTLEIPGKPVEVAMRVSGTASGDLLRCRFVDATGQVFQPSFGPIDFRGWRWIRMPMNDPKVGSWGGAGDGVIHHPIRWDSLLLVDSGSRKAHAGEVVFDDVTLVYGEGE